MTSAMEKLLGKTKDQNAAVSDGTKKLKKYAAAGAAIAVVGSVWKNMMGMIKSVGALLSGIVTTSTNLIKSVWSAYTSTWDALGAMAKDMYKNGEKIRTAYEEIRDTFGDLSTGTGKDVVNMFGDVRSSGEFANKTGMSLYSTFGDMADQLKIFNAIAKEGGEIFRRSSEYWANAGFEALMMNKAFAVGGKAMAIMGEAAERAGESAKEATENYAKMAVGLKKKFGVELKSLGKNFTALQEDVKSFGHLSQKELVATAGYASALGVEVKSLKGMFDSFSNFEDAASGAAKLGEAFGMNVDAMALMNAESPAEQMDMMRQSFMETGKSIDDMSRHQRAYLAETMNVDPNDLNAMFDPANADINYDDMVAAAEDAQKEMDPAEAMREAAKEIKKAFKQMTVQSNTFFGHFKEGFLSGLKHTKPYREFFAALHSALRQVFQIGRDLAKQLFGSGGVFSKDAMGFVGKWKAYLAEIVKWFKKLSGFIVGFAKDIKGGGDPSAAIQKFLDQIFASVGDFFSSDAVVEWNKMLAGFMKVAAKMFEKLATGLIHWVADKIKNIAISWSDDTGVMGAWGEAFMALWEAIKVVAVELWKILGPPLLEGMNKLWEWLKPHLFTALKWMFIIAITKALISAAAVALAGAVLKGILGGMLKAVGSAAASMGPAAPTPAAPTESLLDIAEDLGTRVIVWPLAMYNAAMITLFIVGAFLGTLAAFLLLYQVVKQLDPKMALVTAAIMIALAMAFDGMARAVQSLSKLLPPQIIMATQAGILVVALMVALGLVAMAIIKMIKMSMPMPPIATIGLFFLTMGATMLAAAIALKLAKGASKFAKPQVALGLVVLGATMIALGGVAWIIAKMFSSINPSVLKQVAPIMIALSLLMGIVMLAMPVAGLLGMMLMSFPFGTAGVAIIAAGFAVLGGLAVHMVNELMPAIEKIANIKVKDPASVKQITEALGAIMSAMSDMMVAVAMTMAASQPMDTSGQSTMEENLQAMEGVIDSIMCPIKDIIGQLVTLVSTAEIKPENLQALQAIGDIISSIAKLGQAVTPSPEMMKMIQATADWWGNKRKKKALENMKRVMRMQKNAIIGIINASSNMIVMMLIAASMIKSDSAAKALEGVAKVLAVIVDIMEKMSPSPEQIKVFKKAAKGRGGYKVMAMMGAHMDMMSKSVGPIIRALGGAAVLILNALVPVIKLIGEMKIDPKALEAVAKVIAAVMGAVTGLASGLGPAMTAMQASAKASSSGGGWNLWSGKKGTDESTKMKELMTAMGDMVGLMAEGMVKMVDSIKVLIQTMMTQARAIKDPEKAGKQMGVIVQAVNVIGEGIGPMLKAMDMIVKYKTGSWESEVNFYFGPNGLLVRMMKAMGLGLAILMIYVRIATMGMDPVIMKGRMEVVAMAMKVAGEALGAMGKAWDIVYKFGKDRSTSWSQDIDVFFHPRTGLMIKMMKSAGLGLWWLIYYMQKATKGIKKPKMLKERMGLISLAMENAGKAIDGMGKAWDMVYKYGKGRPTSWSDDIDFFFGTDGLMVKVMKGAAGGIKLLMEGVMEATKGIKRPGAMKVRLELVAKAMEVVGTMLESVGRAMEIMGKYGGGEMSSWKGSIKLLFGTESEGGLMTDIIKEAAYGMRLLMAGVLEATKGIKNPKAVLARIKVVVAGFDAMGEMSTAITNMKGAGGIKGAKADIEGLNDIFADDAIFGQLVKSIQNASTLSMGKTGKQAVAVWVAAEAMTDKGIIPMFQTLRRWSGSPGNATDVESLYNAIVGTGTGTTLQTLMTTVGSLKVGKLDPTVYVGFKVFIETFLLPLFKVIGDASGGKWFKPKTNEAIHNMALLITGTAGGMIGLDGLIRYVDERLSDAPPLDSAAKSLYMLTHLIENYLIPLFEWVVYAWQVSPPVQALEFLGKKVGMLLEGAYEGFDFDVTAKDMFGRAKDLMFIGTALWGLTEGLEEVNKIITETAKQTVRLSVTGAIVTNALDNIADIWFKMFKIAKMAPPPKAMEFMITSAIGMMGGIAALGMGAKLIPKAGLQGLIGLMVDVHALWFEMHKMISFAPPPGMVEFMVDRIEETFTEMIKGLQFKVRPEAMDASVEILGAFADRFIHVAKSLDRVRFALFRTAKFAKMNVTPEVVVQKAAEKIDELSQAFTTLEDLVVDSTMAKVAEGLQGVGELKVNHKGLAINMVVNVRIDSKQLAASLNPDDGAYFVINEGRDVAVGDAEFLG